MLGRVGWLSLSVLLSTSVAWAGPPAGICEKVFDPIGDEKLLSCKYVGGDRATRQIGGETYLTDIGTCWDVDLVSLQKCGCRLFAKSSICCRKGKSTKGDCEWRVGGSKLVDCKPFGHPAFGLAGDTEPEACRLERMKTECWGRKDLQFGAGVTVGPCTASPNFVCAKGEADMQAFLNGDCGPTPEACGCKLAEECSEPEPLKCYKEWIANPAAVRCYDQKINDNGYKRYKCMEDLKK